MRLWEALEKSNKVRRKCWEDDLFAEIYPDKKTAKDNRGNTSRSITIKEFYADDWEPYEESAEEPKTDMETLKIMLNQIQGRKGLTLIDFPEMLSMIVGALELQQLQIDQIEKEQAAWKSLQRVEVTGSVLEKLCTDSLNQQLK